MKRVLALLLLAACGASPAPKFLGAERHDVMRSGRHYVVFATPREVEVIRLGWAGQGAHAGIRADMLALIPEVTGCRPVHSTIHGDSGEIRGRITCPKRG